MTDKTRSSAASTATAQATPLNAAPWNFLTEISRWQMAMAAESACAMFRGVEAMREVQQKMAHETLAQHEAAAHKLHDACAPGDLLSIQSALLRSDLQGAMQYWQQLGGAALKAQVDLMDGSKKILTPSADDPFKPILQAWQSAMPHPFDSSGHPLSTH